MLPRLLSCVENVDRAAARYDHRPIRIGNPLIGVLGEQRITDSPEIGFVFPPVGVNLSCHIGRQTIGNALHRGPRLAMEIS
jgi:hypothetical protein